MKSHGEIIAISFKAMLLDTERYEHHHYRALICHCPTLINKRIEKRRKLSGSGYGAWRLKGEDLNDQYVGPLGNSMSRKIDVLALLTVASTGDGQLRKKVRRERPSP